MVDNNKDDDDDFSFPEEGEYQFDETHDFESEESSFDDSEDFGFTVDEPLEPEPVVAPAKKTNKAAEKSVKKVAGSQAKSKKPLLVMIGLLLFAVISYVMFYNKQGTSIPVPKSQVPQQTAAIKTLPMPGTAPSTQPAAI